MTNAAFYVVQDYTSRFSCYNVPGSHGFHAIFSSHQSLGNVGNGAN